MKPPALDEAITQLIKSRQEFSAPEVARAAGVSRQAAHRRLRRLVTEGKLEMAGAARARRYFAPGASTRREVWRFKNRDLEEDAVWRRIKGESRHIRSLAGNVASITRYAFTEIFNNAIEHSGSLEIGVSVEPANGRVATEISDEGVGIFDQIQRAYDLRSRLDALAELSKGKVTTKPERHTGEGIFFVSRAVDVFEIDSGGIHWTIDNIRADVATGRGEPLRQGTWVRFEISKSKQATLADLFGQYTTEYAFDKTHTLVRLFAHGTTFVSRSEAKRLLTGLDRFREVLLDFDRVDLVGQGFADEVFRVWAREHPGTTLLPVNMNEGAKFMVERVRAAVEVIEPDRPLA